MAGLVVVRRIMATPTACCQGQLQEGDIIMKVSISCRHILEVDMYKRSAFLSIDQ